MLKKILFIYFLFIFSYSANAIEWVGITTPLGNSVSIDKDSITEYNGYLFYNVKVTNEKTLKEVILTIQASKTRTSSARTRFYTPDEYNSLNGDYQNITKNMTKTLEPTTYYSTVNTCNKWVKAQYMQKSIGISIQNE